MRLCGTALPLRSSHSSLVLLRSTPFVPVAQKNGLQCSVCVASLLRGIVQRVPSAGLRLGGRGRVALVRPPPCLR